LSDKQYNVAIGANQQLQWAVYDRDYSASEQDYLLSKATIITLDHFSMYKSVKKANKFANYSVFC